MLLRLLLPLCFFLSAPLSAYGDDILKYSIDEKLPVHTFIADLSNFPLNGFSALHEVLPMHRNLFTMDNQTGHLLTRSIVDRDELCATKQCSCLSCEIYLALRSFTQNQTSNRIIEIRIKDRNDHVPTFDEPSMIHRLDIKENVPLGYRIVLPSANDPDEGSNSIQSYTLTGDNADDFDVDFASLDIPYLIVRSSLDRQRLSSYSLIFTASDRGQQPKPLSSSIRLDIRILSINESIPIFLQSVYSIDVREDASIGTHLLKVEATNDNNQNIFYELLTESPFMIDRYTGKIQLSKNLDYEDVQFYRLTVKASGHSIPTYATVLIRVIDINDNAVSIRIQTEGKTTLKQKPNDETVLSIPENTPIGITVAHVILNDLDSFANGNPYLQLRTIESPLPLIYKLVYQNNFQNTKLYALIVNQNLDRESKATYDHLQLIAHDSGTPTLHTQVELQINLTDVNDCTPRIVSNATIYHIDENNPRDFIVDRLSVVDGDLDQNGDVDFRLLNQTDLLIVDARTGEMRLNQSIDFEKLNEYGRKNITTIDLEFIVEVRDHGQPSLSSQSTITLRIHDLNDHAPEFDKNQSYEWTLSKSDFQPASILGRVYAYDHDSGLQGLVHYAIHSLNPCLALDITSLGFVSVSSGSSIQSCSSSTYQFEIVASDYGLPSPRSTKQVLTLHVDANATTSKSLSKLIPFNVRRTMVDVNTIGSIAFTLDISTPNNHTYQPIVIFNRTNLLSCWNVDVNGEVRLVSPPFASSYILSMNIIDQYTLENTFLKLQVELCNSSIPNSCAFVRLAENRMLFIYAISAALAITLICICVCSFVICLCCRKRTNDKQVLSSTPQHSFLQYTDDFHSEQTENSSQRLKSSSNSTIREDDRDSACIIHAHSSSSTSSSSSGLAVRIDRRSHSQHVRRDSTVPTHPSSSTYHYDLKLAEFLRQNQYPPCVHLDEFASIPQSSSVDYGFSSLELSASSSISTLPQHRLEIDIEQTRPRTLNMNSFVSSRECVV